MKQMPLFLIFAMCLLCSGVPGSADTSSDTGRLNDLGKRIAIRLDVEQTSVQDSSNLLLRVAVSNLTARNMVLFSEMPWESLHLYVVDETGKFFNPTIPQCFIPSRFKKYNDIIIRSHSTTVLELSVNGGYESLKCYGFTSLPVGRYTIMAQFRGGVRIIDPSNNYLGGEETISRTPIRSATIAFTVTP